MKTRHTKFGSWLEKTLIQFQFVVFTFYGNLQTVLFFAVFYLNLSSDSRVQVHPRPASRLQAPQGRRPPGAGEEGELQPEQDGDHQGGGGGRGRVHLQPGGGNKPLRHGDRPLRQPGSDQQLQCDALSTHLDDTVVSHINRRRNIRTVLEGKSLMLTVQH